jgi:hypothetical protein
MHPDTVIETIRGFLAVWSIGRNDKGFMAGAPQVLECSDDGVAHAVDVREKRFRDNRYSHATHGPSVACRYGYRLAYSTRTLTQRGV